MTTNVQEITFEKLHHFIREEQKKPGQSRWLFVQNRRGNGEKNFKRPDRERVAWTGNWNGKPRDTDMIAHWVSDQNCLYIGKRSMRPLKSFTDTNNNGRPTIRYKIPMESVRIFQVSEKNKTAITYEKLLQPQGSAIGKVTYTYWPADKAYDISSDDKNIIFTLQKKAKFTIEELNEIERSIWCRTNAHKKFRTNLFERWDGKCALTKLDLQGLLVASHIKPWAACRDTPKDQTNIDNGLLLLSPIDKLFDSGYITFNENGHVERHPSEHDRYLSNKQFIAFGLNFHKPQNIINIPEASIPFLKYHKKYIFNK